jgi:hypothetical protein
VEVPRVVGTLYTTLKNSIKSVAHSAKGVSFDSPSRLVAADSPVESPPRKKSDCFQCIYYRLSARYIYYFTPLRAAHLLLGTRCKTEGKCYVLKSLRKISITGFPFMFSLFPSSLSTASRCHAGVRGWVNHPTSIGWPASTCGRRFRWEIGKLLYHVLVTAIAVYR